MALKTGDVPHSVEAATLSLLVGGEPTSKMMSPLVEKLRSSVAAVVEALAHEPEFLLSFEGGMVPDAGDAIVISERTMDGLSSEDVLYLVGSRKHGAPRQR